MSYATFKWTHFAQQDAEPSRQRRQRLAVDVTIGTRLDVANLDKQGLFTVPASSRTRRRSTPSSQPLIDRYGYHA